MSDRHSARADVTLVVDYDGVDELVRDYTENLSAGGTFVRTESELAIGTHVHLVLSFPGLVQPVVIEGVVRWVRSAGEDRGVGIEFVNYDERARARLMTIMSAIQRHDPSYVSRCIRLLVVEDNPHMARLIRDGLEVGAKRLGSEVAFNTRIAGNGQEAIEWMQAESFDAAIIDVYMPVMDGTTTIQWMRENENTRRVPIIAMSAGGESARSSALAAGADFFLEKPMRLRQVMETLQMLVDLRN